MFSSFLSACVLAVLTVAIHAMGIAVLLRRLMRLPLPTSAWLIKRLLLRIIWWLILLHLAAISIWGVFYLWRGCLPDADSAFYFSGGAYTTAGYGDLVLPVGCRIFGPLEALSGILMCGLSAGLFFALVHRWISNWVHGPATS